MERSATFVSLGSDDEPAVLPPAPEGATLFYMLALRTSPAGFPMAPSVEEWEALSPAERAAVAAALPGEVTDAEIAMPEGARHFKAKIRALEALRGYFTRQRRRIYLAAEMPTYYPAEPRFAPDLFAVLEADDTVRDKWVVSAEGKGLDWVLEIHVGGDRKKDAERNVARYARLGIPEYFLYDAASNRLAVYRLASPEAKVYAAVLPNHGLYESRVLGLDVQVEEDRLRSIRARRCCSRAKSVSCACRSCATTYFAAVKRRLDSMKKRSSAAKKWSGSTKRRSGAARKRSRRSRGCARSSND